MVFYTNASGANVDRNMHVKVEHVHFDGISRTKYDALIKETSQLFHASTFNELVVNAYRAGQHMKNVGLFSDVLVLIDRSSTISDPKSSCNLDVTFKAQEPGRIKASFSAGVNNYGEGNTVAEVTAQSILGRAESATGQFQLGINKSTSAYCKYTKPFLGRENTSIGLILLRSSAEQFWISSMLKEHAFGLEFNHALSKHLLTTLKYEASWRQLSSLNMHTPFDIRRCYGHSLKSSLKSSIVYSTLRDRVLPNRGILVDFSSEVAGVGGNVHFMRTEGQFKGSTTLPLDLILNIALTGTVAMPMKGSSLSLVDRVFLGGPVGLRGFRYNGIGPMIGDGLTLGGIGSWCAACHVYRSLFPRNMVFAHAFAIAGNIAAVPESNWTYKHVYDELATDPRFCLGAGILVKLGSFARLEFNYCWPYSRHATDRIVPGFQFGIGVSVV